MGDILFLIFCVKVLFLIVIFFWGGGGLWVVIFLVLNMKKLFFVKFKV